MPYPYLEPVRWRGSRPPGLGGDDLAKDLIAEVREKGSAALDALKLAVLTPDHPDLQYVAMGLLVALQNSTLLEAADVFPILEEIVRNSSSLRYDLTRRDAFNAMTHLSESDSISKVIGIARDPKSSDNIRSDALAALAEVRVPHRGVVEAVAWGLLEVQDSHERFSLARALGKMNWESWKSKAAIFVRLLRDSTKQRGEIDSGAIIHALGSHDEPWTRRIGPLGDFFIESSIGADERMAGNFAALLVECMGGNPDQAGNAINLFERNHELSEKALKELRIQVGGAPALSGIVKVLKEDLEKYFQQPIHALNEYTLSMWQDTLRDARQGFQARTWMSVAVFILGVILVAVASYTILFPASQTSEAGGKYLTGVSGLAIMLLVVYTGPLKEIRQSVTDQATASTAFIALVHRVLETSHTFSYYYLKEKITFDEMKKSSALITEAMSNTVDALGRKATDSSEETIVRAAGLIMKQLEKSVPSEVGAVTPPKEREGHVPGEPSVAEPRGRTSTQPETGMPQGNGEATDSRVA